MIAQLQLLGQVLVLVLLYLFVWRVLRAAQRDLRTTAGGGATATAAEESTVMRAVGAVERSGRPARLVAVEGGGLRAGQPFHIDGGLTIGRAPDNDVVLEDEFLSSRHARLRGPNLLTDLDSTNGTFVNGTRIQGTRRLAAGDEVRFGGVRFRFEEAQ